MPSGSNSVIPRVHAPAYENMAVREDLDAAQGASPQGISGVGVRVDEAHGARRVVDRQYQAP